MTFDYGKLRQCNGLKPCEKPMPSTTTKAPIQNPPNPKDGVFVEPPKAPPKGQVWIPKLNHLNNPIDTLLDIPKQHPPKNPAPMPRVNQNQPRVVNQPPRR